MKSGKRFSTKNQKIKKLNPVDSLTIFNYDKLEYNDIKLSPLKNKKAYNQHYSSKNNWQKLTQTITKEKTHFNLSNANNFKLVSIIEGIENDYFFISTLHIYPYSDALNDGLFVYSEDKKKMFNFLGAVYTAAFFLFIIEVKIAVFLFVLHLLIPTAVALQWLPQFDWLQKYLLI